MSLSQSNIRSILREEPNYSLLNNNQFGKLYENLYNTKSYWQYIGQFTELFFEAGIDPLLYTSNVPDFFLLESDIAQIAIPDNCTFISRGAFMDCHKLEQIRLHDKLEGIGSEAFSRCYSLIEIDIPSSVKYIHSYAFSNCNLVKVILHKGLQSIYDHAFNYCKKLNSIIFDGTINDWDQISKKVGWNDGVPETCKIQCLDGIIEL